MGTIYNDKVGAMGDLTAPLLLYIRSESFESVTIHSGNGLICPEIINLIFDSDVV